MKWRLLHSKLKWHEALALFQQYKSLHTLKSSKVTIVHSALVIMMFARWHADKFTFRKKLLLRAILFSLLWKFTSCYLKNFNVDILLSYSYILGYNIIHIHNFNHNSELAMNMLNYFIFCYENLLSQGYTKMYNLILAVARSNHEPQ